MNKFILLTACITPLFLVNVNAAFQGSSAPDSKASAHKLDNYLRVKCNLPKISDDQVKNITKKSIDDIKCIQQQIDASDGTTKSMQEYCKDKKESVFGKAIEIAQDLALVAKMYGDFDNAIILDEITENALKLYTLEGDNFKAISDGSTDTPEYSKNEEEFRRFIDRDLLRLLDIASEYSNVSSRQNITEDNPPASNIPFPPVDQKTTPQIEEKSINDPSDNITEFPPAPVTQPENGERIDEFKDSSDKIPLNRPSDTNNSIEPAPFGKSTFDKPGDTPFGINAKDENEPDDKTYNSMDHINEFNNSSDKVLLDRPSDANNSIESTPFDKPGDTPFGINVEDGKKPDGKTYNLVDRINEFDTSSDRAPFDRSSDINNSTEPAPFGESTPFDRVEEAKEPIVLGDTSFGANDQSREPSTRELVTPTEPINFESNGEPKDEGRVIESPVSQSTENLTDIKDDGFNAPELQSEKPIEEPTVAPDKTDGNTVEGDTSSNDSLSKISSEQKVNDSEKISTPSEKTDSSLPHTSSWGF